MALPVIAALAWSGRAYPCAPNYPAGEDVGVDREEALIVWDEARHMEHFVRSAEFHTTTKSFGFLVPTPSRPTLGAADDRVFVELAYRSMPETVYERQWSPSPLVGATPP